MKYLQLFILIMGGYICAGAQPEWSINTGDFFYNMPAILIAEGPCNNLSDQMAVFDDFDVLRGFSAVNSGEPTFFITVYSNVTSNETLHIKYYDAESDEVFNLTDVTFQFSSTGVIGIPDPFPVPVPEAVAPVAICKEAMIYLDELGMAELTYMHINNNSSDNCDSLTYTVESSIYGCTQLGSNTTELIVIDASGNADTCIAQVMVLDTIRPTATCKDVELYVDSLGRAVLSADDINMGSTDNCSAISVSVSRSDLSMSESYTHEVFLIVEDGSGNKDSCLARVTLINKFENDRTNCTDGIDNDGDGLVDCADPECGMPSISNVLIDNPSPLSCSSTAEDGSLSIEHVGGDYFEIDRGAALQSSPSFSGLAQGVYEVWVRNNLAGCADSTTIELVNTYDPFPPATPISITGPEMICPNSQGVNYTVNGNLQGELTLTYSGQDVGIMVSGSNGLVEFGAGATSGKLVATLSTSCTSESSEISIGMANSFICENFANCLENVQVSNAILENSDVPQVYSASGELISDASLPNNSFEFTAGQSISLEAGFTAKKGYSFIADIKNCAE